MSLQAQLYEGVVVTSEHVAMLKNVSDLVHQIAGNRIRQVELLCGLLRHYGDHGFLCQLCTGAAPQGHRLYQHTWMRLKPNERVCTCHWNEALEMLNTLAPLPQQETWRTEETNA